MKTILNKSLTILLFAFSIGQLSFAQSAKEGFYYGDKIAHESSVYIMTNQHVIQRDTITFSCGDFIESSFPELWKATYHHLDSITYEKMDSVTFLKEMEKEGGDWLMFVHGAGKTFERAIWRAFDINHFHGINVVVFSWPASNPREKPLKDLKGSLKRVPLSRRHLKESILLMQQFRERPYNQGTKFSLLLHSMGNMFLEQMIDSGEMNGLHPQLFDNLIINAAAVNQKDHKRWVEQLDIQKRIYVTTNKGDVNLLGVQLFTKYGKQLGEKIKSPPALNANYVNFTDAIGFELPPGVSHTYFIAEKAEAHPEIFEFYQQIFHGNTIQFENNSGFVKRKDGIGYDIIVKEQKD